VKRRDDSTAPAPNVDPSVETGVRKAHERKPDLLDVNEQLVLAIVRANEETEEAQAESTRLRATEEELRLVAEFRERWIGVIGHDLRNPLNAIMMAADLLVTGERLTGFEAELARRIQSSARRMHGMIARVVEFTRARLGGEAFPLDLANADLGALCEQIAAELRLGAGAEIDTSVVGEVTGTWDVNRLGEALSNLASNAADYATAGTSVSIDVRDAGDDVVVAITNRGPSIPEELMPVLFDPFRHARNDERKSGHLGLGLYVAQEITRLHGGTLDARSADGITTFTMRLPRSRG